MEPRQILYILKSRQKILLQAEDINAQRRLTTWVTA